jgi:hypothetical protein
MIMQGENTPIGPENKSPPNLKLGPLSTRLLVIR